MSEGYPLLTLPANEAYQLAHIATYIASTIARRRAVTGRSREAFRARGRAARDLAGGREAFARLTGAPFPLVSSQLPQPLDVATFNTARELLSGGPRWAEVVSLSPSGASGWAMLGHVPGLGPVGARVHTRQLAEALRQQVLTRPADELTPWAVTDRARRMPAMPAQVDLPEFVTGLDPASPDACAVAAALRGTDQQTDAAIADRFAGIDVNAATAQPRASDTPPAAARPAAEPADAPPADQETGSTTAGAEPAPDHAAPGSAPAAPETSPAQPEPAPAPTNQQPATPPAQPSARRSSVPAGTRAAGRPGQPAKKVAGRTSPQRRGQPARQGDDALDRPAAQPRPDDQPAAPKPAGAAARRAARLTAATRWTYRRPPAGPATAPGQSPG